MELHPLQTTEHPNDHGINQINEKPTHQRHDKKRLVRRTILLGHGGHIDDGGRGRTERNPAKA
ncbi:hypothetical protein D3C73_1572590 [compost metagenome]